MRAPPRNYSVYENPKVMNFREHLSAFSISAHTWLLDCMCGYGLWSGKCLEAKGEREKVKRKRFLDKNIRHLFFLQDPSKLTGMPQGLRVHVCAAVFPRRDISTDNRTILK